MSDIMIIFCLLVGLVMPLTAYTNYLFHKRMYARLEKDAEKMYKELWGSK